jgi:hypothetical protein
MAHYMTDAEFPPQSPPYPALRSSTPYTATTILTVTVYSRKIPDGVTVVTHGSFSRLTTHRVTSESTADSVVNGEGGSDIDPGDAKAEEFQKFLHYIGFHDEANTSTWEPIEDKAGWTSCGVSYINKYHNFPDRPYWDWERKQTPKKDECGRRIVRWGEISSERKFIMRRVTHVSLFILVFIVVAGMFYIVWKW